MQYRQPHSLLDALPTSTALPRLHEPWLESRCTTLVISKARALVYCPLARTTSPGSLSWFTTGRPGSLPVFIHCRIFVSCVIYTCLISCLFVCIHILYHMSFCMYTYLISCTFCMHTYLKIWMYRHISQLFPVRPGARERRQAAVQAGVKLVHGGGAGYR
jgi:antibiotic biosynthesis monooxygenase (ABM) superfamily enzyme